MSRFEETEYKNRVKSFFQKFCKKNGIDYWMTSLGFGAKAGIPDQWFQFFSVSVFFENKRKGKKASAMQAHRIKQLKSFGFIAFCESADPGSTGANGEERQKVIRQLLAQLEDNEVLARAEQYVEDCYTLRVKLEKELI